jgi:uncharacterized membrane protein YgcG
VKKTVAVLALAVVILLSTASLAFAGFYCQDGADMLSPEVEQQIEHMGEELNKATKGDLSTGVQIGFVSVPSLKGRDIKQVALEKARQEGYGSDEKDNGALLFVALNDHKMRIETGYGLEGSITDATAKRIIDNVLTPAYRKGDFDGGTLEAYSQMIVLGKAAASGARTDSVAPTPKTNAFVKVLLGILGVLAFGVVGLLFVGFRKSSEEGSVVLEYNPRPPVPPTPKEKQLNNIVYFPKLARAAHYNAGGHLVRQFSLHFEQDGINSARRLVGAKEYTSQDMTIPMLFSSLVGLVATTGIPKTFLQTPPPMSGVPQANADAERRRRDEEERQRRRRREEEEEEQRRRRDDDFNSFGGGGLGSFGGGGSDFGGGFDIGGGGDFGGGGADGGW